MSCMQLLVKNKANVICKSYHPSLPPLVLSCLSLFSCSTFHANLHHLFLLLLASLSNSTMERTNTLLLSLEDASRSAYHGSSSRHARSTLAAPRGIPRGFSGSSSRHARGSSWRPSGKLAAPPRGSRGTLAAPPLRILTEHARGAACSRLLPSRLVRGFLRLLPRGFLRRLFPRWVQPLGLDFVFRVLGPEIFITWAAVLSAAFHWMLSIICATQRHISVT